MEMAVNFFNYFKNCVLNCDAREKRSRTFICCLSAERNFIACHFICQEKFKWQTTFCVLKDST